MSDRRKCWASGLGNCEGGLSREHVLGNTIFDSKMVTVTGAFSFAPTDPVAAAELAARILCRRHNSALSDLDSEARTLIGAIRQARTSGQQAALSVNGPRLERWTLKVLSNLLAARWTQHGALLPGIDIVSTVYGGSTLTPPSGLYAVSNYRGSIETDSVVLAVITSGPRTQVLGLLVALDGLLLVLSTCKSDLRDVLQSAGRVDAFDLSEAFTAHHPAQLVLGNRMTGVPLVRITLDWVPELAEPRTSNIQNS